MICHSKFINNMINGVILFNLDEKFKNSILKKIKQSSKMFIIRKDSKW
jgi:hypothetical protein